VAAERPEERPLEKPAPYPPDDHVLRDLQIVFGREDGVPFAEMPVFPEICDDRGAVRAGVLAIFVDVFAGSAAVRAVQPDWIATGDLALCRLRPSHKDRLRATARVLRAGRRTVVLEVELRARRDLTSGSGLASAGPRLAPLDSPCALATMTFSRLPRRDTQAFAPLDDDLEGEMKMPLLGPGLQLPLLERIGLVTVDAAAGIVEVPKSEYIANSLRAIQGGVMALIAEAAGESAACRAIGSAAATVDLSIHYLELCRAGPVRTSARVLRSAASSCLVRVELRDAGDDDRLLAVATATALGAAALED